jgi:hypothetical protein
VGQLFENVISRHQPNACEEKGRALGAIILVSEKFDHPNGPLSSLLIRWKYREWGIGKKVIKSLG